MSNIKTNPWSFTSADVLTATPTASPNGLVLQSNGWVLLTTGSAHGFVVQNFVTEVGATNALYNGSYRVAVVPSTTTALLAPYGGFSIPAGTSGSGGGTIILNQYPYQVRVEDISWQNPSAAGQLLVILDRNGNPLWEATATGAGSQNRGKVFWVDGLVVKECDSGIVLVTIN